jgi:hypothetical protein
MLKLYSQPRTALFQHFAEKLVGTCDWELLNSIANHCLFRHRVTKKVFKLVELAQQPVAYKHQGALDIDEELPQLWGWGGCGGVFMQMVRVSEEYYLEERSITSLHHKINTHLSCIPREKFNE